MRRRGAASTARGYLHSGSKVPSRPVDTCGVVQQQNRPPAASIFDLIDDALHVVGTQTAKKIAHLLDETHMRLLECRADPRDRVRIAAARAAAQELAEYTGYHGFQAGMDAAYAVDQLTARLLLNTRITPAEWERTFAIEELASRLLGPRR